MQMKRTLRLITVFVGGMTVLLISSSTVLTFTAANTKAPAGLMADGPALYGSKCAICHGKDGVGTPAWRAKGQPDLSSAEWQKSHSDQQIADRIRSGKGKMPAFGNKLSEDEVTMLVKQVRNLRK